MVYLWKPVETGSHLFDTKWSMEKDQKWMVTKSVLFASMDCEMAFFKY